MISTAPDLGPQYYTELAMKAVWCDLVTYCLLRPVSAIVCAVDLIWDDSVTLA